MPFQPSPLLLLFVVMWVGITGLLSHFGGWSSLSAVYPDRGAHDGESFRFASMSIGKGMFPMNYGSCVSVRVGTMGIGLSMLLPLRLFHPPLFIPWSAVLSCDIEQLFFVNQTALYLTSPDTRLRFTGRAGRAIQQRYDGLGLDARQSSGRRD